jgi:hypothetical protein
LKPGRAGTVQRAWFDGTGGWSDSVSPERLYDLATALASPQ